MALHTYRGVFGSTWAELCLPAQERASRRLGLDGKVDVWYGPLQPRQPGDRVLATSTYRCPPLIAEIAADLDEPLLARERHSLNMEDAPAWGLSYTDPEDGHLYWSVQDYTHPAIYDLAQETRRLRQIMLYEDYQARYDQILQWQVDESGEVVDQDIDSCDDRGAYSDLSHPVLYVELRSGLSAWQAGLPTASGRRRWASMLSFSRIIPVLQTRSRAPTTGLGMASCPRRATREHTGLPLPSPANDAFLHTLTTRPARSMRCWSASNGCSSERGMGISHSIHSIRGMASRW